MRPNTLQSTFEDNYIPEPNSGCWLWIGYVDRKGYGRICASRETGKKWAVFAHRISWMLHRWPIPASTVVRHKCDTPCCVNPDHLAIGTPSDNVADMVQKNRQARGERIGIAKITGEAVAHIRRKEMSQAGYARIYGVDQSQISRIQRGKQWGHL